MKSFRITISSDLDYEQMVVYIDYGFENFAILSKEEGPQNMRIEILNPTKLSCWEFRLDELEEVIQLAKKYLIEMPQIENNNSNDEISE